MPPVAGNDVSSIIASIMRRWQEADPLLPVQAATLVELSIQPLTIFSFT